MKQIARHGGLWLRRTGGVNGWTWDNAILNLAIPSERQQRRVEKLLEWGSRAPDPGLSSVTLSKALGLSGLLSSKWYPLPLLEVDASMIISDWQLALTELLEWQGSLVKLPSAHQKQETLSLNLKASPSQFPGEECGLGPWNVWAAPSNDRQLLPGYLRRPQGFFSKSDLILLKSGGAARGVWL